MSVMSVSYTHLDVYKRQEIYSLINEIRNQINNKSINNFKDTK